MPNFKVYNLGDTSWKYVSQGTPGDTGVTGSSGDGVTGLTGNTGVTGLQGVTGLLGNTGVTGLQGITGITGLQGVTGKTGAGGSTGVTGYVGATGVTGLVGATGITGATGVTGITGITGVTGLKGGTGVTGLVGSTGVTGLGVAGVTGLVGASGVTGSTATGVTGIQGATGVTGVVGVTGSAGIVGATGITGSPVGATGVTGLFLPYSGALTTAVTINSASYVTGGVTLTSQTATVTSSWRIRANGKLVNGTQTGANTIYMRAIWGATSLPVISVSQSIAGVAFTTGWECDYYIIGGGTTTVYTKGVLFNHFKGDGTDTYSEIVLLQTGTTTVSSGAQTIDFQFEYVPRTGDAFTIDQISIERLI
jgi:hypothetical protein